MNKDEKIAIAWCDSGNVEGAFASGIHFAITGHWKTIPIDNNYYRLYYESKGIK